VRTRLCGLTAGLAVGIAACGGSDGGGGDRLDRSLGYFPADSGMVVVVSTDLESEQLEQLDDAVSSRASDTIEGYLERIVEGYGLSYEDDVEPLLGGELVVGSLTEATPFAEEDVPLAAVLRAPDGDELRELVERHDRFRRTGEEGGAELYVDTASEFALQGRFAVEDDIVVFAADDETLRRALAQREADDRLTEEQFRDALADLPEDASVKAYAGAEGVLGFSRFDRLRVRGLERLRGLEWMQALESFGVAVSMRDERLVVDVVANTDAARIDDEDLPLALGPESPEVLERDGDVLGANRDQSLTTAFLFRAAERLFADSRFVHDVHELERQLGIDFVAEVLRQFDGPSASLVSLDGRRFAARSDVRDPERLRQQLRRLAPHLPRLVEDLEGLRSEGQALLFLVAPDIVAGLQELDDVRVIPPRQEGDLYRVTGLTGDGPDELFFGLVDDRFVVASDDALAREVASAPTEEVDGASGAAVLRVDLAGKREELEDLLGFDPGALGAVVGSLEASEERLRGTVAIELR
jgi:hypothetical protein